MLSAFILSKLSYAAMLLAEQQLHQWFVQPGPLVLGSNLFNLLTPTADRDRTVSRRSEPSSRTALNGEQPYPWDLLVSSWGRSACYPRGTFYPLSDDPSTQNHRITMTDFRLCSTCLSYSQAGLCHYTLQMISNHFEPTFASLRYFLGGDRPSQTTHQTLSYLRITQAS